MEKLKQKKQRDQSSSLKKEGLIYNSMSVLLTEINDKESSSVIRPS